MVGRKSKPFLTIIRPIYLEFESGERFLFGSIPIQCPICGSEQVRAYGTRKRKNGRIESFRCQNMTCSSFRNRGGIQFCLTSSKLYRELIWMKLQNLSHNLFEDGIKYSALAEQYQISISEISSLRFCIQTFISQHVSSEALVDISQPDRAIAMDETYIKIDGKTYYVILATGYTTHKCLGMKISESRYEQDMREVFDEADRNTIEGISTITADALNATQAMAKNLGREITLIIHKHKTPYDKVVIRHFTYKDKNRITTEVGVKTDVFKHRKKREFFWRERIDSILPPTPKKKGRPLGKWKKKKKPKKPKQKRGRKGLFTVFTQGKKAYLKSDPGRLVLQIGLNVPIAVSTGLHAAFELFARMSIQNNLSEHLNSLIKALVGFYGPKNADTITSKIRITLRVWNQPNLLQNIRVDRWFHGPIFLKALNVREIERLQELGWIINNYQKNNAGVNLSSV